MAQNAALRRAEVHPNEEIDMNQLSQLLYLANVVGNLGGLFIFFGILLAVGAATCVIAFFGIADSSEWTYIRDPVEQTKVKESRVKSARSFFNKAIVMGILALVLWTLAAFVPSKETVYAIAASEMGEELMKTPTATKAVKALDAWLDEQIANNTKAQETQ